MAGLWTSFVSLWRPFSRHDASTTVSSTSASRPSTIFFGSQIGGQDIINYSYTDMPWKLMVYDIYYFFYFLPMLPYIVFPYSPTDSGDLDELAFTKENVWCILVHSVLVVLQLAFILALPFAIFFPLWMTIPAVGAFLFLNKMLCKLLNGEGTVFDSDPKYAAKSEEHAHEAWVFVNGVAVGEHWLKNNLNRLALTFGRPVTGIHNRTSGIIFDVVECLIQRNFGYATSDIRICYREVKKRMYSPQYDKVIFILHSQGGIEGGMVLDWLLQELPQNLLSKLEVYTFGNAANHFNDPHRQLVSQVKAKKQPLAAAINDTQVANGKTTRPLTNGQSQSNGTSDTKTKSTSDRRPPTPLNTKNPRRTATTATTSETISPDPFAISDRALGHVEHYAHTTDFVALWGVLHFATSQTASNTMPRFIGRLFSRTCPDGRGGHQFCQHYLDGMFPLARDSVTGQLTGCAETGNEFMESEICVGVTGEVGDWGGKGNIRPDPAETGTSGRGDGGDGVDVDGSQREPFESSWLGCISGDEDTDEGRRRVEKEAVEMHNGDTPIMQRRKMGLPTTFKVKELSRLWKYRNGKSPAEKPPGLTRGADGVLRGATM